MQVYAFQLMGSSGSLKYKGFIANVLGMHVKQFSEEGLVRSWMSSVQLYFSRLKLKDENSKTLN